MDLHNLPLHKYIHTYMHLIHYSKVAWKTNLGNWVQEALDFKFWRSSVHWSVNHFTSVLWIFLQRKEYGDTYTLTGTYTYLYKLTIPKIRSRGIQLINVKNALTWSAIP